MAIIKKRVDQLQIGDVVVYSSGAFGNSCDAPKRDIVTAIVRQAPDHPENFTIAYRPFGDASNRLPMLTTRLAHIEFDVEVPDAQSEPPPMPMTPPPIPASEYTRPAPATAPAAQQHIDALAALLDQAVRWFTPGSVPIPTPALGEWCAQSRKLLEAVTPQAPTLDEALAMIARLVAQGAVGAALNDAERLLNQARRAGVMK